MLKLDHRVQLYNGFIIDYCYQTSVTQETLLMSRVYHLVTGPTGVSNCRTLLDSVLKVQLGAGSSSHSAGFLLVMQKIKAEHIKSTSLRATD